MRHNNLGTIISGLGAILWLHTHVSCQQLYHWVLVMPSSNPQLSSTTTTTSMLSATLLVLPSSSSPPLSVSPPTHQDLVLQLDKRFHVKDSSWSWRIPSQQVRASRRLLHQPPLLAAMQMSMKICTHVCYIPSLGKRPAGTGCWCWWGLVRGGS